MAKKRSIAGLDRSSGPVVAVPFLRERSPDPKNRNPVWLLLSSQAVAVVKSRKPVKENPHVFASRSKSGHIKDTRAPPEQLSKKIGMNRLSAHDLRRAFVALGVKACRLYLAKLELLTNHVPQGITARHYLPTSDLVISKKKCRQSVISLSPRHALPTRRRAARTSCQFGRDVSFPAQTGHKHAT